MWSVLWQLSARVSGQHLFTCVSLKRELEGFALVWEDVTNPRSVSDLLFSFWQALLDRVVCHVRALAVLPTKELAQQVSSDGRRVFMAPVFSLHAEEYWSGLP